MAAWLGPEGLLALAPVEDSFRSAVKEIASLGQCTLQVAIGQQERGSNIVPTRVDLTDAFILLIFVVTLLGGQSLFRGVVQFWSKKVLPEGKGLPKKFAEAAWEFVYYTFSIVIIGLTMVSRRRFSKICFPIRSTTTSSRLARDGDRCHGQAPLLSMFCLIAMWGIRK